MINIYRLIHETQAGESVITIWSGQGHELSLLSVEEYARAINRVNPRLFLRGSGPHDHIFLKSFWYGVSQTLDENPELNGRLKVNQQLLEKFIRLSFQKLGYSTSTERISGAPGFVLTYPNHGILFQTIIEVKTAVPAGEIVEAVALPWLRILKEIKRDPAFLFTFAQNPRAFEEFIAACYDRSGWDEVILTPSRGDLGRDVIATNSRMKLRFLDQAKAYSPGRVVTANDIRAMWGVLNLDANATKAIVTTTSRFAPSVFQEFERAIPYRLELRDGPTLAKMLQDIVE